MKRRRFEHELCIDLNSISLETDFDPLFNLWNQGRGVKPIQGLGEAVLSREHAQAVTEYLLKHKHPASDVQGFTTRYLIRKGILDSLHIKFERGVFEIEPNFKFRYADLKTTWWYHFACNNRDAVNGSGLGARIKGNTPSDYELGLWIRAMGIVTKATKIDVETGSKFFSLKEENLDPAAKRIDSVTPRKTERIYSVNAEAMNPLLRVLYRRFGINTMPWVPVAEKHIAEVTGEPPEYDPIPEPHPMVSQCAFAIRNLLPTLGTAVGTPTINALVELLPQFDFFEIVETYYLVGSG
ncbi:hypothetical protein [Candidatus Parabeggiatoa sp. HSG14]|uniref:hypothetical protein n=1 Tax=Candidatus Parabeggiatoa sp. HSG14 TaxID=3055593 RepID=UPI0025A7898C|nr:hypothetical protein [Thiotrichales bacterium HSG14]